MRNPALGESGQGLTEYIVLLMLVCVVSIVTVRALGTTIKSKISEARNHINHEVVLRGNDDGDSGRGWLQGLGP